MRVYLVRHAEAAPGEPDDLRPLTPAGWATAGDLGTRLAAEGARPAVVLTSPLLRARETAGELAGSHECDVEADERLAPRATPDLLRAVVADRGAEVVVVGHQPDCGRFAAELSGGAEPSFPPGGLAVLEL